MKMRLVKELLRAGTLTMAACAGRKNAAKVAETRESIKNNLLNELETHDNNTTCVKSEALYLNCK